MKKFFLAMALLVSVAFSAAAQGPDVSWGVTGGLNLTKLKPKGDGKTMFSSDNQAGWFIGPKVDVNLVFGFGLDASLVYSQQKYSIQSRDASVVSARKTMRSLAIPVNLRYSVGLGGIASAFLTTGPQFDFYFGDKSMDHDLFERENMVTSWNVGAGVKVMSHVELGIGYNFALGKVGETLWGAAVGESGVGKGGDVRSNTFTAQATIYF